METDIGREESLNGTKERAFTLIGDPGDEAGENLLPTKQGCHLKSFSCNLSRDIHFPVSFFYTANDMKNSHLKLSRHARSFCK